MREAHLREVDVAFTDLLEQLGLRGVELLEGVGAEEQEVDDDAERPEVGLVVAVAVDEGLRRGENTGSNQRVLALIEEVVIAIVHVVAADFHRLLDDVLLLVLQKHLFDLLVVVRVRFGQLVQLRLAEVDQLEVPFRVEHQVVGFEVAVAHPVRPHHL